MNYKQIKCAIVSLIWNNFILRKFTPENFDWRALHPTEKNTLTLGWKRMCSMMKWHAVLNDTAVPPPKNKESQWVQNGVVYWIGESYSNDPCCLVIIIHWPAMPKSPCLWAPKRQSIVDVNKSVMLGDLRSHWWDFMKFYCLEWIECTLEGGGMMN